MISDPDPDLSLMPPRFAFRVVRLMGTIILVKLTSIFPYTHTKYLKVVLGSMVGL